MKNLELLLIEVRINERIAAAQMQRELRKNLKGFRYFSFLLGL